MEPTPIISESEVFALAFNRNVQLGTIKPAHIVTAQDVWLRPYLGCDLYDKVVKNQDGNYDEFIENYCKPVVAWGALYHGFDYMSINITEKGIIQMLVEGTANVIDRTSRLDAKLEIKQVALKLTGIMQRFCHAQKRDGEALFLTYDPNQLNTDMYGFTGSLRMNKTPY